MITINEFRSLALSFPDTAELPHFQLSSFLYKKKIFATWWEQENHAMLKLSPVDQSIFCGYDKTIFFPVDGTWGKQGATFVDLARVRKDMFKDALKLAYEGVAKKSK